MSKPYLNLDLLRRVRDHIAEEPRRFVMEDLDATDDVAPCGTAACIAGWSRILSPDKFETSSMLLFGDNEDYARWDALCIEDNWPPEYQRDDGGASHVWRRQNYGMNRDERTPEQVTEARIDLTARAVRLLDDVIARGEIWWSR